MSHTYRDGTEAKQGDIVIGKTTRTHPVIGVLEALRDTNSEKWNCQVMVVLRLYNEVGKIVRAEYPNLVLAGVPDLAHTRNLLALHLPEPLREEHLWT